ncbi:MAG: hypothetical protein ABIR18_15725 [Chitinophagaceae bacterium]
MRWLLFLSRLAFICGICFLLSLSLRFYEWTKDQDLAATIITIGFFMGILVVPGTLLSYLVVLMVKKNLTAFVPLWLVISNILFLFALLIYIISINAQNYNPA